MGESRWAKLLENTLTHLWLTLIALLAAICVALPLGVFAHRMPTLRKPILTLTGILQTIPSIALLMFMIPILGVGWTPAIAALFLYALLPILQNTAVALASIDPTLTRVSVGMGLTRWQRLRYIELPLAAPTILTGIRTATVITIGTATLAAFIGAGGLGDPIVAGLSLNDTTLVLEGAIPAALLAIGAEISFGAIERWIVPTHLRQSKID